MNLNNWLNQRVQNLESQLALKDLQIEELDSQSKATASEFDKQNISCLTASMHENMFLCKQSSYGMYYNNNQHNTTSITMNNNNYPNPAASNQTQGSSNKQQLHSTTYY